MGVLVQVRQPIPFPINVPDGAGYWVHFEGRRFFVVVRRGVGAHIVSYRARDVSHLADQLSGVTVPADHTPSGTWFEFGAGRDNDDVHPIRAISFESTAEPFVHGYIDDRPFAILKVFFELDVQSDAEVAEQRKELAAVAWRVSDHFVSYYRLVSNHDHGRDIQASDSPVAEILVATEYRFGEDGAGGAFRPVAHEFRASSYASSGRVVRDLPPDARDLLKSRLAAGTAVPIRDRLLLDAKERSTHYQDHPMAVVLVEAAFEVAVAELLRRVCLRRGIIHLPMRAGRRKPRPAAEAIDRGSILSDLIEGYAAELAGASLKDCPEYQAWRERCYDVRNEIVHGGHRTVGRQQFVECFESAVNYFNWIVEQLAEPVEEGATPRVGV